MFLCDFRLYCATSRIFAGSKKKKRLSPVRVAKNAFHDRFSIVVRGVIFLIIVGCGCVGIKSQPTNISAIVLCCVVR